MTKKTSKKATLESSLTDIAGVAGVVGSRNLDINPFEDGLAKSAGIDLYKPNVENVEQFIRKYVLNEIAFFPKTVKVSISINPQRFNTENGDLVSDAIGMVTLSLHDKPIQLDFIIREAEFIPFDTIRVKDQVMPYTRENLARIFMAIDKINSDPSLTNPDSPYKKLEEMQTTTTDPGFLGNTLKIQDEAISGGGYTNAKLSATLDSILEKTAAIKRYSAADVAALETKLAAQYHSEFADEMQKTAAAGNAGVEGIDEFIALVFSQLRDVKWVDVNSLANGAVISFPRKQGRDITMERAIVLKDLFFPEKEWKAAKRAMQSIADSPTIPQNSLIVLAESGDYAWLKNREKFYAIDAGKDAVVKTPTKPLRALKKGETYLSIIGNKTLLPFRVDDIEKIAGNAGAADLLNFRTTYLPSAFEVTLATIPNLQGERVQALTRDQTLARLKQDAGREISVEESWQYASVVLAANSEAPFVQLGNVITEYLRDPKQLMFTEDETLLKSASFDLNRITLTLRDKDRDTYDLKINWRRSPGGLAKTGSKMFDGISGDSVKDILRTANIDYTNIIILMQRTAQDGRAMISMPEDATPEKIEGGHVKNRVASALRAIGNNLFARDAVEMGVAEILGRQLGDVAIEYGPSAVSGLEEVGKWVNATERLAEQFEKAAQEYNSPAMLNVAKLMVSAHNIDKAMLEAARGGKLTFVKEACAHVVFAKPALEKIASELISLKRAQYDNRNELIPSSAITGAVSTIDRLYKLATVFSK